MDILNLWNDDPEEVLLDLGFGCDEPYLSGGIPARFINHQSQARGINLQVFLEAQKNRLDLENPDVNNRFRQLEVLQQVTTAFSSLVGSPPPSLGQPQGKDRPPEVQEKRKCISKLFRLASKRSLSETHNNKNQDLTTPATTSPPCAAPETPQPLPSNGGKKVLLKKVKPGLQKTVCLSPLAEEQEAGPDMQALPDVASLIAQEDALTPWPLREVHCWSASTFLQIHSFDESCATGSYTRGAEDFVEGVTQSTSCQSDSLSFLEELFIPSISLLTSPGSDLIKVMSSMSGGSTYRQSSERPDCLFFSTFPSLLLSSSLTSPGVDKSLLSLIYSSEGHSFVCDPSLYPISFCQPNSDLQILEIDTPSYQSTHASLPALICKYLSPGLSSSELQNITHFQSQTLSSPVFFVPLSPTSSSMQPASLIKGLETLKTEDKDAPSPYLFTLFHDSEGAACFIFSSAPSPASSSTSPNLDYSFSSLIAMSSAQSDSSSGSHGNTQSEQTDVALHENPLSAFTLLYLLPSSPYLPPCTAPDFDYPSSSAFPSLNESLSQSPENNQKNSIFLGTEGKGLSDPSIHSHKKEEETSSHLLLQSDTDNPLFSPSQILDYSKFKRSCATLPCLSTNTSTQVCQTTLSFQLNDPNFLIDPTVTVVSDLTKKYISQQARSCSHNDNIDPAACSVRDIMHVKMDHLSLDSEDSLQINGKKQVEGERDSETMQTREVVVYNLYKESSAGLPEVSRSVSREVCNQTILSCCLNEFSIETKVEELGKVCQKGMNCKENESPRSSLVLLDDVPETQSRTEVEPKDLIKMDSLDLVCQISVDDSQSENGDVDALFQQLDTEGRVHWAKPFQVSSPTPVFEESGSFEASVTMNSMLPRGQSALDSFSSIGRVIPLSSSSTRVDTDQNSRNATALSDKFSLTLASFPSLSAILDLKPSSQSVNVQMSLSPSSHIIDRKDIPYMTHSKCTLLPSVLSLDTSTPFRAVQSWTDLQIQRNILTKRFSHGALHTVPKKVIVSPSASEMTQGPTMIFSLSPSFPQLSTNRQSHDYPQKLTQYGNLKPPPGDKGLLSDEEEEVDRNVNEDKEKLWEDNQTSIIAGYCTSDQKCVCCTPKSYNEQRTLANLPYSQDELEEMVLYLQKFCSVLGNMEEQLFEDQTAVYSVLSDLDRKKVRDIEELRQAVKEEAAELEMQLTELASHYVDSLKMKMHRLLDEQSLLCSQLRVLLPGKGPTTLSPTSNRTVATQCCLLPWIPMADVQSEHVYSWMTWNVDSLRQSPPGSGSNSEGLGFSHTKAEKLDIGGFLQRAANKDGWSCQA